MRGKPQLTKLTDKHGNLLSPCWYVRYFDGKRSQRCSTGCQIGTEDHEAQIFLAQFILERERPTTRNASELMVAIALDDYWQERGQFLTSQDNCERHIAVLKQHFNGYVSGITKAKVQAFIRKRKESVGNATINRELAILSAACNHEVDEGRLLAAPRIKKLPATQTRKRWLTPQEEKRLLKACYSQHLKDFITLSLHTGQRPAAIENLTWFQVDIKERMIYFTRGIEAKENKGRADVYMNDEVLAVIKRLNKIKKTGHVLEYKGEPAGCVKKAFQRACKRAGLDDVSRYTLRHTVGTKLRKQGVPLEHISELLGHKSTKITDKHYAHHTAQTIRKTAQKLHNSRKHKI